MDNNDSLSAQDRYEISRRQTLLRLGGGFGALALGSLLHEQARADRSGHDLRPRPPVHQARTKAVIQLFMHGGPSHVDLLDPKPMLNKYDGQPPPGEVVDDENRTKYLLGSPFIFRKHGESGIEFSEIQPHVARHADRIAVIRSMFSEHRNHEQAIWMAQTGLIVPGRPTLGAWSCYGLGSFNQNLPGYIVLRDPNGHSVDGIRNWSSGWLPPIYQGTPFRSTGSPVLNLQPSQAMSPAVESGRLALLRKLNDDHRRRHPRELELDARISNLELAARMQLAATDAVDISQESKSTHQAYGLENPKTESYGRRCLMARRLVERGVRYIQILMQGQPWDTHQDNVAKTTDCCMQTDQPVGALLTDLEQRGLLDSTLVLWGGEFGRTPGAELRGDKAKRGNEGRDHHPYGFSVWMAGGGVKGGQTYGATDDFGYRSVENRTQMADYHATILHLLGLDHDDLTYDHNGRSEKLTDVYEAKVIPELIS
tara:strand:- start:4257 stop:5705 length:1449 start_codon:yes stop_codon:yes gene_type:complete